MDRTNTGNERALGFANTFNESTIQWTFKTCRTNYRNLSEQKRFGHLVLYLETFSKTGHITQHFKTLRAIPVTAATIYP